MLIISLICFTNKKFPQATIGTIRSPNRNTLLNKSGVALSNVHCSLSRNFVAAQIETEIAQCNIPRNGHFSLFLFKRRIGHFTVVWLVTWPLSGSEAGGDLVLIQTLLLFTCKSCCSHAN